jgi:hypothetical protein
MTARLANRDAAEPTGLAGSGWSRRQPWPDRHGTASGRHRRLTGRKIAPLQNPSDCLEKDQNLDSSTAVILPGMCLILKAGFLPIPGGLQKYTWRGAGLRLAPPDAEAGSPGHPEKDQKLNSGTASIPSRMYLSLKDGILPIPGRLLEIQVVRRRKLRARSSECGQANGSTE